MFEDTQSLSDENKCAIDSSFSTNSNWPYDWSSYCPFNFTNDNIHQAVDEWRADSVSAEANYGYISNWDVSSVTDMSWIFGTWTLGINYNFNSDISSWDVSNVTNMNSMFSYTPSFNQDISGWDVSNVTYINYMFGSTQSLSLENKCAIQESFSSNSNWPYDWSSYCVEACPYDNYLELSLIHISEPTRPY